MKNRGDENEKQREMEMKKTDGDENEKLREMEIKKKTRM